MYTIIKEQSGDKIEYTVADMRTGKTIGVYATADIIPRLQKIGSINTCLAACI